MTRIRRLRDGLLRAGAAWRDDRRGASAVEFSIVALPFVLTLLMVLQVAVYYMTQSALDSGVVAAADSLTTQFNTATAAPVVTQSSLATLVASKSGGLVKSTTVLVDLEPLQLLDAAPVAVGALPVNIGSPFKLLGLRAQAPVTAFFPGLSSLPGFGGLQVRSSAVLRRQGI